MAHRRQTTELRPRPADITQYRTPDDVFRALQESGEVDCRGFNLPANEPGQTGTLLCRKLFVATSDRAWSAVVWFYEDEYFAEREYRRNCRVGLLDISDAGEWLVWSPGQTWLGAIRDRATSFVGQETPPESVAISVAEALGSEAWGDCSAVP
jgi:hypothetical protein